MFFVPIRHHISTRIKESNRIVITISINIQTRFGFELKWQKAWLAILLFALIGAITSSVINYNEMWDRLLVSLQIGSLATIFSGIAALGVITQLTNHPYVFTTPDNSLSSNLACCNRQVKMNKK
jgi:hypothetical protein